MGGSLTPKVSVRLRGPAYRLDDLSSVLGFEAPPAPLQHSPAIWVGDRLHNEATTWLELRQASLRNDRTVSTNANQLVGWIRVLGSRGQTVHTAREVDYRAYEARCRFPTV